VWLHLRPVFWKQEKATDAAVRRLIYEAGDDLEDLMSLCRADVTSKNGVKVRHYLKNFDKVEEKMRWVEEKDALRNFQPVITGDIIMQTFGIKPSRMIGELKRAVKEAILEGEIKNEYEEVYRYLLALGKARGLQAVATTQ
jgi:poly(A) polymerase